MAKIHLPFKVKVGKTVKGLVCGLNGLATKVLYNQFLLFVM